MTDAADLARRIRRDIAAMEERLVALAGLADALDAAASRPAPAAHDDGHSGRAYSVAEAAERLSVSEPTARRLVARGDIRSVKIAGLRRVPAAAIDAYLARLDEEQHPLAPERPEFIRHLLAGRNTRRHPAAGKEGSNVRYRA